MTNKIATNPEMITLEYRFFILLNTLINNPLHGQNKTKAIPVNIFFNKKYLIN